MKFASNKFVSNPGSPIREVYAPKVNSDGSVSVVATGKENFDQFIQSFALSTDISFILAKLSQGDTSVLHQRSPMYGDFSKMPSTYAEVLQLQIDAGRAFDRLPPDVKRKFDNDVNKFLASAGSSEWFSKVESVLSPELRELLKPSPAPVQPSPSEKEVTG